MFHHVLLTGLRTEIHQQNIIIARLCIWTADLFDRHNIQNIQAHCQRLFRRWCRGTCHVLNRSVPQKSTPEKSFSGCFVLVVWLECSAPLLLFFHRYEDDLRSRKFPFLEV